MKHLVLSALLFMAAVAAIPTETLHPLSDEYIAEINKKATTWVAGRNFDIRQYESVKLMANGVLKGKEVPANVIRSPHNENIEVPETFDAREQWPNCESIPEIKDQSGCQSSWAVAAASAMSDRICIASNQTNQVRVSYEDLNSCCDQCGDCQGGYPSEAWYFWGDTGIVTGGLYGSNQGCRDYTLEPCEHHVEGSRPLCSDLEVDTPACRHLCQDLHMDYYESKTYGQDVVYYSGEKQIQIEVMTNGPIEVDFTVHSDFYSYKNGIYQPTTNDDEGTHAVKLIGWGVENNVKYWVLANSWNEDWGDKGYFKMIRGVDSCGIETEGVAALPRPR